MGSPTLPMVAFRQKLCLSRQASKLTCTDTHLHSWYCGCVWRGGLWGAGPGWPVGTAAHPQVQIRTKQEVWGKDNTHRVMDPLSYSFVYHCLWLICLSAQCSLCTHTACVPLLYACWCVCTRINSYVWLFPPSYLCLLCRLSATMKGCVSVLSLLKALSLSSNLWFFSKYWTLTCSVCCSHGWIISSVARVIFH